MQLNKAKLLRNLFLSFISIGALQFNLIINPVSAITSNQDSYAASELIIKYKTKNNSIGASLIANLNIHERQDLKHKAVAGLLSENLNLGLKSNSQNKLYRTLNQATNITSRSLKNSPAEDFNILLLELDNPNINVMDVIQEINNSKLSNDAYEIEEAYPNYFYEISSVPNDTQYSSQWALERINAEEAWNKGGYAKDMVIAVIDTGVDYSHEDLAANIWTNPAEIPGNGKDDDGNGYIDDYRGWDFVQQTGAECSFSEDCSKADNDPQDFYGHGTHVAGIIAAVSNNSRGIAGLANKAKIMPLRAGYAAGGGAVLKASDIILAINYAIDNKADVINMSFAGPALTILSAILQKADAKGIISVAAAGNAASSQLMYPAAIDKVIAVGSISSNNQVSTFSSYGPWVDIFAPGSNIISTEPGGFYAHRSGTSMASPYVAAAAAMIKSNNQAQNINAAYVKLAMLNTASQINSSTAGVVKVLNAAISYGLSVDSMELPTQAFINESVNFNGSGRDSSSAITAYEWRSNIVGILSTQANFTSNSLPVGKHTISFRVQNAAGAWSQTISKSLEIKEKTIVSTNSPDPNVDVRVKYKRKQQKIKAKVKNLRTSIVKYRWTSDRSGLFSGSRVASLRNLPVGYHILTLEVEDINGTVYQGFKVVKVR